MINHKFWLWPAFAAGLFLLLSGCAGGGRAISGMKDGHLTTCFVDYTENYKLRIYQTLLQAPGVTSLERLWQPCRGDSRPCLCYAIEYHGAIEELELWLQRNLPLNKTVPFHCIRKGPNRLDVIFDAGFK